MIDAHITDSVAETVFDIWKDVKNETVVTLSGSSMHPVLQHGDSVCIQHTRRMIGRGELIAFRQGNKIIVHRVLRRYASRNGTVYISRGDHNCWIDPRTHERNVIGIVTVVQRQNGECINLTTLYQRLVGAIVLLGVAFSRTLPTRLRRSRASAHI